MEEIILSNLIQNEKYTRKVLPYLKDEYFLDRNDRLIYSSIYDYVQKYNVPPTKEVLKIAISDQDISQENYEELIEKVDALEIDPGTSIDWLVDETEKFCQDKAIYNALHESIKMINGKSSADRGVIPEMLMEAIGVSFDQSIGHDFLDDAEARYDFYHTDEVKIPFDIDYLNKVTGNGVSKKTLNVFVASTGIGKSLMMCHFAAYNLLCNKNVLYITMEMSEEKIAQRIDANMMHIPIQDTTHISREEFMRNIDSIAKKTKGKLVIKEYPNGSASTTHFRHLLGELKLKSKFVPDIIYIDYVNICASSRIKNMTGTNSYGYIKAVTEELRALAVDFDVPVITATQLNRGGMVSSDIGLEDTSESIGLTYTADLMLGVISTDELRDMGVAVVKQLKNRYGDLDHHRKFAIGINRKYMKLHDIDKNLEDRALGKAQEVDDPVMDNTEFGEQDENRNKSFRFKGFKNNGHHNRL